MEIGIGIGITQRQGGGFSPLTLFAAGEQGVMYDPSNWATLFQNTAGTTPVTAVEQSVDRVLDVSGRGNHATQVGGNPGALLRQDAGGRYYLRSDGTNDGMQTAAIDFSATNKVTIWVALRKLSDAGSGCVLELGDGTAGMTGTFQVFAPPSAVAQYQAAAKGTTQVAITDTLAAPVTSVLSVVIDLAAPVITLRRDGVQRSTATTTLGTGNFSNRVLNIFRRNGATLTFNGWLYGLIVRGAASSATELAAGEAYLASKCGITL